MSTINPLAREINVKIVYYGPGLSGKTTSLQHIHQRVRPESRGELLTLSTEGDRTLFFDYLPVLLERVNDLPIRLQLYTVPGQVFYDATRKLVLNGADGVVFVADSQEEQAESNRESLANLEENLDELGTALSRFPWVIQYNKRDLPTCQPIEAMRAALNRQGVPEFETVASQGRGVFPAFKQIVRSVIDRIKTERPLDTVVNGSDGLDLRAARPPPEIAQVVSPPQREVSGVSFRALSEPHGAALWRIEHAIGARQYGLAISMAAAALSDLLTGLPPRDLAAGPKVTMLGLDGREYLRLSKLVGKPDGALTERDALFALYLAIAAVVKAETL